MKELAGYTFVIDDDWHIQTEIYKTLEEAYTSLVSLAKETEWDLNVCVKDLEKWMKETNGKTFEDYGFAFLFKSRDECADVYFVCAYKNVVDSDPVNPKKE